MPFVQSGMQAYTATLLTIRTVVFFLRTGCTVCWFGKPWLFETSEGGRFLSTGLRSLGVVGIKLGQYLSQRPDLLTDACRVEMAHLTDRNPPVPWSYLQPRCLFDDLSHVDTDPLGTGSLAQVHRVKWHGKPSVLKVLLPGDETVRVELNVCRFFLNTLRHLGILPVRWDTFIDATESQLDLQHEANELEYAYHLFGGPRGHHIGGTCIKVPQLRHNSPRCIIMEQATGQPLHSLPINSDASRTAHRARKAALLHMTTSGDQRFHADLHDGNVLFDTDLNTLWLIDFGLCVHPPLNWVSPLPPIIHYAANPSCPAAASNMLCAVFSIEASEAMTLLPIFHDMFSSSDQEKTKQKDTAKHLTNPAVDLRKTATNDITVIQPVPQSLRSSTVNFFRFTRRVDLSIAPHTIAYFMQLIAIGDM
jgi:serine/threonine protein kinase